MQPISIIDFKNIFSIEKKFLKSIIEIDKALKVQPIEAEKTLIPPPKTVNKPLESSPKPVDKSSIPLTDSLPAPGWVDDNSFELPIELKFKKELLQVDLKFEELLKEKELVKSKIVQAGFYKRLLYEKGKPLEEAISKSLKLLGFENNNAESNGEMVFQSEEGKFFIEVEGTDDEAIGFEKLRQLEVKILEDYSREDNDRLAKGILFANAYRTQDLKSRNDFFSAKCASAAKRNRIALVRTQDLFWVVKYLSDNTDVNYAKKCREVILKSEGEVANFPEPPKIINSVKDFKKETPDYSL